MLTIFGKKKKDDASSSLDLQSSPDSLPTPAPTSPAPSSISPPSQNWSPSPEVPNQTSYSSQPQTQAQPMMRAAPPPPVSSFRPPPPVPMPDEETSLSKILQSLLQDIPIPSNNGPGFSGMPQSTPEYVPVRNNPPSRPMTINPGKDSGEWEEQDFQPSKQTSGPSITPPKAPSIPVPASKPSTPTPAVAQKPPDKQSKADKPPEKVAPSPTVKREPRPPQGFDHIFQLTQGNLESTGLVIVNGTPGSGRTTLCSGLIGNYMKMGNPCLYLTFDQAPSNLRDQMKKLGTDAPQYESQFRFIIVDGYASQSESFSMEPYYLDSPFSFDNITDTLVRNSGIFAGEKIRVIFDSLDKLAAKVPAKDFSKGFEDLVSKLKDAGCTFIATIDMSQLPKDVAGAMNDLADCVIDLSKDKSDPNGRQLEVQRVNRSASKIDPETFEIDSNKGLIFL